MNNYGFEQAKREYLRRQSQGNKNTFLILLAGILVIMLGIFINNNNQKLIENAKTTTGIAYYEKNSIKSSNDLVHYDVYVKYTVQGKEYYEHLKSERIGGIANISNKNGKAITIYYNPNNPTEIIDKSTSAGGTFLIGFGVVISLIVIGDFVYRKIKGLEMDDPTPNYKAAEKVANFAEELNNETDFHNKVETVGTVIFNVRKISLIIVSFLIIIFGIFSVFSDNSFSNNAKQIVAVVSKIEKSEERDNNNKRYIKTSVYVKYNVDGKQYEEIIDTNASTVSTGSKLNIYYNENNPREIKTTNKKQFSGFIIITVGVLFLMGGVLQERIKVVK